MIGYFRQFCSVVSAALTMFEYADMMCWNAVRDRLFATFSGLLRLVCAAIALYIAPVSYAQTTTTYVNGTDGTISGATPCNNPLVRNFVVGGASFTVADVELGFFATHSWRGDIRLTLESPDGTRVQLVDGDANSTSGDNLNVLLDDAHAQTVNTDSATGNHSTAAPPPFANNFSPNAGLAAFNGVASAGTWRLEICDIFTGADNGTFRHAELYLTSTPPNYADLSVTKSVSNTNPLVGNSISYTVNVNNNASSPLTATGVVVTDLLPTGVNYVSHSATAGSYNSGTGLWNVGTLAPGTTRTLTINVTVTATAGAVITNFAEVTASSQIDSDSTPNNGVAAEDDYSSAAFTVGGTRTAGTPPTLVCPNGFSTFDWAGRTWPQGSTSNDYTLTGVGAFDWDIVSPAGFMDIPALGGQHPVLTNAAQGVTTLSKAIDFTNDSQFATTTITLGTAVDGAQFTIFDVDYAANDFADRVRVYGTHNGVTVIPVLTNGISNYVIGNEAFGDAGSDPADPDGNVVATFNAPVDTIIIEYGNHALAPADPDGQAIQMNGGITICSADADLTVLKSSTILEDPVNGIDNPKALPGARLRYCILLTNTGTSAAENVDASDTLPADITYIAGTLRSGTTCVGAATVEDDNNSGADETDPAGASFAGGVVNYLHSAVNGGTSAAITFEATIN